MKVAIAADHAGFKLKGQIAEQLEKSGHEVLDLGAHEVDVSDDYPDFARYVGQAIQHQQAAKGIVICGSGVGASIAANKLTGVRAAICHDVYSAHQGVEHDDMNVLCIGSRVVGPALVSDIITAFVNATFDKDQPRFVRRLEKVLALENSG